jgi:hypothetical protein
MSPPTGWTAVPGTDLYQSTNARIHAWYRVASASEPSAYAFTIVGSGDDMSGGIVSIAGADPSAPISASGGQVNATSSRSVTAPSITPGVDGTLLLFGGACNVITTFAPPPGMTEATDAASSGTYRVATEIAWELRPSAGATGARIATAASSCRSVAIQVAVAPAP